MPNAVALPTRSATRTRNMNIRRARQLEESWELTFETLLIFITTLQEADLYDGYSLNEMYEDLTEILSDIPAKREWSQLYLFKLCSMPTGSCPHKKRIKRAVNGWKTACEAFYIINDLSKDINIENTDTIVDFRDTIKDIFTENWLNEAQDESLVFQFCVDGYNDRWNTLQTDEAQTEEENSESTDEDTDSEDDEMPDLISDDEDEDEDEYEDEDEDAYEDVYDDENEIYTGEITV